MLVNGAPGLKHPLLDNSVENICNNVFSEVLLMAYPDSKVHGANMGANRVLSAPDGPHVGPMNLPIRVAARTSAGAVMKKFATLLYIIRLVKGSAIRNMEKGRRFGPFLAKNAVYLYITPAALTDGFVVK